MSPPAFLATVQPQPGRFRQASGGTRHSQAADTFEGLLARLVGELLLGHPSRRSDAGQAWHDVSFVFTTRYTEFSIMIEIYTLVSSASTRETLRCLGESELRIAVPRCCTGRRPDMPIFTHHR
jgi:hypothetical protein